MNNNYPQIYMIKLIFHRVVVSFRVRKETTGNDKNKEENKAK